MTRKYIVWEGLFMDDNAIKSQIKALINRLGGEEGKKNEFVNIRVDSQLRGQEAVNFEVVKIFTPDMTHQELVNLIFRLGLKDAAKVVKLFALERGINI